ncbi:acyl carrier protein, partial [Streptomyces globosus]
PAPERTDPAPERTDPAPEPAESATATTEPTAAAPEPGPGGPQPRDSALRATLAELPRTEWAEAVLGGVRGLAAAVLGYESASEIDAEGEFLDMGLTSVTALELRDHLTGLTGLEWPADLLYEYPTPRELADAVADRLTAPPA